MRGHRLELPLRGVLCLTQVACSSLLAQPHLPVPEGLGFHLLLQYGFIAEETEPSASPFPVFQRNRNWGFENLVNGRLIRFFYPHPVFHREEQVNRLGYLWANNFSDTGTDEAHVAVR